MHEHRYSIWGFRVALLDTLSAKYCLNYLQKPTVAVPLHAPTQPPILFTDDANRPERLRLAAAQAGSDSKVKCPSSFGVPLL
jgi:hypothetical protein